MFSMEKFARLFTNKRKDKGLTQGQLAELVGVTHQAVSKWERGEAMPEISKIGDIAKALDTPADEFMNAMYDNEEETKIQSDSTDADNAYFELEDKTRVGDIYALAPKMSKSVLELAIDTLIAAKGAAAATMLFRFADRAYLSNLGAELFAKGDTRLAEYVDESTLQGAVVDMISKAEMTPHHPEKCEYFTKAGQLLTYCHEVEFINAAFDQMIASHGNWDIWRGFIGRFPSEVVVDQGVKIATRLGPNCFYSWWEIIGRRNMAKIFIGYIESYEKNNFRAWQDISRWYTNADGSIMEKYIKERLADEETKPEIFKPLLNHLSLELKEALKEKGVSNEQQQNGGYSPFGNMRQNKNNTSVDSSILSNIIIGKIADEIDDVDIEELPMYLARLKSVGILGDMNFMGNSSAPSGNFDMIISKLEEICDSISDLESRMDDMESRMDDLEE